tara:strand:- start:184 stop:411 length:228 start_codon:yes stop_codon:yes gene_type:complete
MSVVEIFTAIYSLVDIDKIKINTLIDREFLLVNYNATFKLKSYSPKDYDLKVGTNIKYFFKSNNLDLESFKLLIK